jgi:hypothetical protein
MDMKAAELSELLDILEDQDITVSQVIQLVKDNIKKTLAKEKKTMNLDGQLLAIKYPNNYQKLFDKYDLVDPDVNIENFPITTELIDKKIQLFARQFVFDGIFNSDLPGKKMAESEHHEANLVEALKYVETYGSLQGDFTMVALGSIWRPTGGTPMVVCLEFKSGMCKLILRWLNDVWNNQYIFLGIKNKNI